jgi:DNA-binding CsgD family transcriptional regulator
VLLCDGPALLAWVGGYREAPFEREDMAVLTALIPAFSARARLERNLASAATLRTALDAAMDALGSPAFLVQHDGRVAHSNRAGASMQARKPALTKTWLDEARHRGTDYDVFPVKTPGIPAMTLVVMRKRECGVAARIAEVAERWRLTPRQGEVMAHVIAGDRNQTIAAKLGISLRTVELHVSQVLVKADVSSRAELVAEFYG